RRGRRTARAVPEVGQMKAVGIRPRRDEWSVTANEAPRGRKAARINHHQDTPPNVLARDHG
ncbi:hypothetical protein K9U40_22755, partial [Xanthobacter autotrophicus]|uniref:hypothetical protein n=1 Tax=Xanthobacter autotrophicus TaxID=280 RepID=UPI0024ABAA67